MQKAMLMKESREFDGDINKIAQLPKPAAKPEEEVKV